MIRKARRFPLVADNEILIGANPVMSLYDESDLISNIKGPYQERDFVMTTEKKKSAQDSSSSQSEDELLPPLFEATPSRYSRKDRQQLVRAKLPAEKTQCQS